VERGEVRRILQLGVEVEHRSGRHRRGRPAVLPRRRAARSGGPRHAPRRGAALSLLPERRQPRRFSRRRSRILSRSSVNRSFASPTSAGSTCGRPSFGS
jgi:hypothetical protein